MSDEEPGVGAGNGLAMGDQDLCYAVTVPDLDGPTLALPLPRGLGA